MAVVLAMIPMTRYMLPSSFAADYPLFWLGPLLAVYVVFPLGLVRAVAVGLVVTVGFAMTVPCGQPAPQGALVNQMYFAVIHVLLLVGAWLMERRGHRLFVAELLLEEERERSERLLLNILPAPIAERLKAGEQRIADGVDEATVLFCDLAGFTDHASGVSAPRVVEMLNEIFTAFDDLADRHGVHKVKTIGDAYMAVAGLPEPHPDALGAAARLALGMHDAIAARRRADGSTLDVRIGLHTGPVVAGVIGKQRFAYDLWGDTVNTASRMESHGGPGRIQVSAFAAERLRDRFQLERRGVIPVKGKGRMETWWLVGEQG